MKTKEKIIEEKRNKVFDKLAKSIGDYLRINNWDISVISTPQIKQEIGSLKYNYILEFKFTGRNINQTLNN